MHITPFCPSSFSLANKLLTSHVWLSCEGKKIKYILNINKKERISLGRKKMLQNMSSLVVLERVVRHSEKPVQRRPATVRERDSASTQGLFRERSAHPCQSWLRWGRQEGKEDCCSQPLTSQLFFLSHKWRVKIPAQDWKTRPFFPSSTVSVLRLFILFPWFWVFCVWL